MIKYFLVLALSALSFNFALASSTTTKVETEEPKVEVIVENTESAQKPGKIQELWVRVKVFYGNVMENDNDVISSDIEEVEILTEEKN